MKSGRVLLACDHGGTDLKNGLVKFLESKNLEVLDLGTHDKTYAFYCDYVRKVAQEIKENDKGIVVCSTGLGISIATVKTGLKCSIAFNQYTARECRKQGCQVMSMGAKIITLDVAKRMTKEFLDLQ